MSKNNSANCNQKLYHIVYMDNCGSFWYVTLKGVSVKWATFVFGLFVSNLDKSTNFAQSYIEIIIFSFPTLAATFVKIKNVGN